jgi:hypothetical protein
MRCSFLPWLRTHEIFCPPKAWAEALWPKLVYWNELDKGGHFAAFEQPALFTEEMRKPCVFSASVRSVGDRHRFFRRYVIHAAK